jgi:plasmid stabilization system protein ParE
MVQINWTLQAIEDLRDIYDFISKDSKIYAQRQVVMIKGRTNLLKEHVKMGRMVPEMNDEKIREIIVGNYPIIYMLKEENSLDILTIHHAARNLTSRQI